MILKPGPFKEPEKKEVQSFRDRTKVEPKLNRNDVIISLIVI